MCILPVFIFCSDTDTYTHTNTHKTHTHKTDVTHKNHPSIVTTHAASTTEPTTCIHSV